MVWNLLKSWLTSSRMLRGILEIPFFGLSWSKNIPCLFHPVPVDFIASQEVGTNVAGAGEVILRSRRLDLYISSLCRKFSSCSVLLCQHASVRLPFKMRLLGIVLVLQIWHNDGPCSNLVFLSSSRI